jgi:MFS family permease
MLRRARTLAASYPRQFWLLFWGMLVNASGGSMVWPFLTIYLRERLQVPLTTVALMLTAHSLAGLISGSVAGPLVDRFGRKGAMVLSLSMSSVVMLGMSQASSLTTFLGLMLLGGAVQPLYRVGVDAMVADLIPPTERPGAYALLRMIANLGVAIGPAVGGFVASVSYTVAFYIAAGAHAVFAGLLLIFARETLPRGEHGHAPRLGGYGRVLRDHPFLAFCAAYALAGIAYSLMMVLLPVYAKENFGVPERAYGFIMATNAAMVVLLQYATTRRTQRHPSMSVLAVGSVFYAVGVGLVGLSSSFFGFWLSMVVLTVGEMIMIPTSTALTASLAPPDMRGRYMSVYALTWGLGFGIGPVIGGLLNDRLAPVAIWAFGALVGVLAAAAFAMLSRRIRVRPASDPAPSA